MKIKDRLKYARIKAGFKSAAKFSAEHDILEVTYRAHENGTRGLTSHAAQKYAKLLNISLDWLLSGNESQEIYKNHKDSSIVSTTTTSVLIAKEVLEKDNSFVTTIEIDNLAKLIRDAAEITKSEITPQLAEFLLKIIRSSKK